MLIKSLFNDYLILSLRRLILLFYLFKLAFRVWILYIFQNILPKVEARKANLFKCRSGSGKKWLAYSQAIKMEAIAYFNSIANG